MTKPIHICSPRAFAATVAALALAPLPALAQDAAPAADPAAPAPAVVSAPVVQTPAIVLPDEPAAAPAASAATTTTAATPSSRSASAAAPRAAATARTAAPAAPAASSSAQTLPPPSAGPDAATGIEPAVAAPVVAPVAAVEPQPVAQPDASRGLEALALGGALAALGAGALFALTRRRRRVAAVADQPYEPENRVPFTPGDSAVPVQRPMTTASVAVPAANRSAFAFAKPATAVAATAPAQTRWSDGPVPSGSERHWLVARMVADHPDAANPFRTAKARRRRARLILQGREQRLQDKAQQPFDFRQYRPSENADTGREPAFA